MPSVSPSLHLLMHAIFLLTSEAICGVDVYTKKNQLLRNYRRSSSGVFAAVEYGTADVQLLHVCSVSQGLATKFTSIFPLRLSPLELRKM